MILDIACIMLSAIACIIPSTKFNRFVQKTVYDRYLGVYYADNPKNKHNYNNNDNVPYDGLCDKDALQAVFIKKKNYNA